jgi:hypothetical protein
MAATYDIGDVVRLTGTFTVSSTNTDPTTITLKVKDPSGNTATYTYALAQVTKSAVGIYYYDLAIDEAGIWRYEWTGTGTCQAVAEGWLEARESRVG